MTMTDVLAMLDAYDFLSVDVWDDEVRVTVEDFDGFDDDWCEILVDYDDAALAALMDALAAAAVTSDPTDFYPSFDFDGFRVVFAWASYDI